MGGGLPAQDLHLVRPSLRLAEPQVCPWVGEGLVYSSTDDLRSHEETAMLLGEVMGAQSWNTC